MVQRFQSTRFFKSATSVARASRNFSATNFEDTTASRQATRPLFLIAATVLSLGFFLTTPVTAQAATTTNDGMLFYSDANAAGRYREYTNANAATSKLGTEAGASQGGASMHSSVMRFDPTGGGDGFAVVDGGSTTLYIDKWSGSAWSSGTTATISNNASNKRAFDAQYESNSGDFVVVYEGASGVIKWRRWNGSVWSDAANVYLTSEPGTTVTWMELAAHPFDDTMILVWADANRQLNSIVYDGATNTWNESTTEEIIKDDIGNTGLGKAFDVVFEQMSGQALVSYVQDGNGTARYRTHSGVATDVWGAEESLATGYGADVEYIDLAAQAGTDKVAAVWWLSGADDIAGGIWGGSSWLIEDNIDTTTRALTDNSQPTTELPAVAGWAGSTAVITYADSSETAAQIAKCTATTGNSWTCARATGLTNLPSDTRSNFDAETTLSGRLVVAYGNTLNDLYAVYTDDGSTWSCINSCAALETGLAGPGFFDLAMNPEAPTYTWDGGGVGANMSTAANWAGDVVPSAGSKIVFAAGTKAATWDASTTSTVKSITLNSGYTNTVTLAQNIDVYGSITVTAGTFEMASYTVDVYGDFTVASGAVVDGDWVTANHVTFLGGKSSVSVGGAGTFQVQEITINAGKTVVLAGNVTTLQQFTLAGSLYLNGKTLFNWNAFSVSGTFSHDNGTLKQGAVLGNTVTMPVLSTYVLEIVPGWGGGIVNVPSGTTVEHALLVENTMTANLQGDLGTVNITVDSGGTLNLGSSAHTITGDITINGTLTSGTSTVTLFGLGGTQYITTNGQSFYNLSVANTHIYADKLLATNNLTHSGSGTIHLSGSGTSFSVGATFTPNTGKVSYESASGASVAALTYYNLTVAGTGTFTALGNITAERYVNITGGTLALGGYNLTAGEASCAFFCGDAVGAIYGAGNLTQSASGTTTLNGNGSLGGGSYSFGNLTIGTAGYTGTASLAGDISVSGVLSAAQSTNEYDLSIGSYTITLSGTGSVFALASGNFLSGTGTVAYTGNGSVTIASAVTYYNLSLTPTITANRTYTAAGALTVNGNLTINPTASGSAYRLTVNPAGTVTVAGLTTISGTTTGVSTLDLRPVSTDYNLTTGTLTIASAGTLDAASAASTITISSTGTPFSVSGTYTVGSSTVAYTGNGSVTVASTPSYYNLSLIPTITAARTYTAGGALTISNNFTINPTASVSAYRLTVNPAGTITVGGHTTISGTTTGVSTLDLRPASTDYNLTTSTLNVASAGTLDATSAASTITVSGTGVGLPFGLSGTFTPGSSTFIYSGTGSVTTISTTYYNLTFSGGGGYTFAAGTTTVNGNLTLSSGTLTAATNNPTLAIAGNVAFSSGTTYTKGTGTTTLSGSSKTATDSTASKQDLGAVSVSGSYSLGSSIKVTSLAVAGTFTVADGQTVTVTGTGATTLNIDGTLSISGSGHVACQIDGCGADIDGVITFGTGSTPSLTVTGTTDFTNATVTAGTGALIIGAATNSQYTISLAGKTLPAITVLAGIPNFNNSNSTINGLTVTGGIANFNAFDPTVTIVGNVLINGGELRIPNDNTKPFTVTGNFTYTSGTFESHATLGRTILSGSSTQTVTLGGQSFSDLDITNSGTVVFADALSVADDLTVTGSGTIELQAAGTALSVTGTLTPATGTITYTSGSGATVGAETYYNLIINGTGTFSAGGTITVNNGVTVTSGTLAMGTNNLQVGSSSVSSSGSVKVAASQSLTQSAAGTTTIVSSSAGANCIGSNGASCSGTAGTITFGGLSIGDGVSGNFTTTLAGDVTVSGVLTIASTNILDASSKTITLSGTSGTPFVKTGTFTPSTSTVVYSGANAGGNTNVAAATYNNLQVTGSDTYDVAGDTTVSGVLTIGGSATLDGKTRTITLSGTSGTPFVKTGTFTPSTSTVVYSGANTGGNTNVAAATYNNLQVTGSDTYDVAGDTTVSGVLTIGGSATLDGKTRTITLSGTSGTPFVKTGTFTPSTSTVTYTGDNSGGSTTVSTATYYNLITNNASETYVAAAGSPIVNNDLTITAGSLDLNTNDPTLTVKGDLVITGTLVGSASSPLNVDGDWTNNGTFTHSNGTVAFTNSAGLLPTSNIGGSNGTDFYSFSVTANGKYVRFAAAKTFGIAGVLTVTGGQAIDDNIRIYSSTIGSGSSSDQWLLNLTGSSNVTFAIVQNGGCAPGSSVVASHTTNTNAGNNGACWPFATPGAPDVTGGRFDQPGGGTPTTGGTSLSGGISGGGGGGAPSPDRLDEPGGGTPTTGGTDQGSGGGSPAP